MARRRSRVAPPGEPAAGSTRGNRVSSTAASRVRTSKEMAIGKGSLTGMLQLRRDAESDEPSRAAAAARPSVGKATLVEQTLQRRAAGPAGGGAPLPEEVRARMERAFGADFSAVRIHEGPQAEAMGALAYTQGDDIHFAPGRYDPVGPAGQELLGHELAHVVQQREGRVAQPQGKDAPVNADAALEAEADALGARAARGEAAADPASAPPRAPASSGGSAAIQRFADPTTGEEVDIANLERDAVEKYLDLIQKRELKVSIAELKRLSLRRKVYQQDRENIGASNREGMDLANSEDGPRYLHNVPLERRREMTEQGLEPGLGYADPAYFDRTSKFTWRVKPQVSAAAAIRAFIRPGDVTIAECQSVLQAVFYHTVLRAVGDAKFDAVLGAANAETPAEQRLLLQMDFDGNNPLGRLLESLLEGAPVSTDPEAPHALDGGPSDHIGLDSEERGGLKKDRDRGLVSAPDHRPVKLGGWYYMKNHRFYTERHKGGLWGGENALYVGRDDDGHQVFSGFGLSNCTEAQMAEALADETNAAPSEQRAEQLFKEGKLGFALPVLGDIGSVAELHLTDSMIAIVDRLWKESHEEDPASENEDVARQRLVELLGAMELPQPVTAEDILSQFALSEVAEGIGAEAQNEQNKRLKNLKQITLAWEPSQHPSGAACVRMTATTTKPGGVTEQRSELTKYYAEQYRLEYHSGEMGAAVRLLNPGAGANIALKKDQAYELYFPLPSVYVKRLSSPAGFQMLGGKNLSPDKIKQVFGVDELFAEG